MQTRNSFDNIDRSPFAAADEVLCRLPLRWFLRIIVVMAVGCVMDSNYCSTNCLLYD